MRPLDNVIEATLKIIPKTFENYDDLSARLNSIRDSFQYSAPEAVTMWWQEYVEALETFCSPETYLAAHSVWIENLQKMVNGETDYREYL